VDIGPDERITFGDDLSRLMNRAGWLGQRPDEAPTASFTSIFLSLLSGQDPWSQWAQRAARLTGVTVEKVLARWTESKGQPAVFSGSKLRRARSMTVFPPLEQTTPSARELIDKVLGATQPVKASPDVPHMVGAFIYGPRRHGDDLAAWGFVHERWDALFYSRFRRLHPEQEQIYQPLTLLRKISIGITESLGWAGALGKGRPISAKELALGIVVDGARYAGDPSYASAWLVRALGSDPKALVRRPLPAEQVAGVELDESAHEMMDQAALFATACHDREIHVRHLLLAAFANGLFPSEILWRGHQGPELGDELLRWHLERNKELAGDDEAKLTELYNLAKAVRTRAEPRAVILNNDEAHGEDALGIRQDAWAMASVLASRKLKPPLSVGLFGDWGSGKSFFMDKLRKRIEELARSSGVARRALGKTAFHSRIVQIEFNAWQYMDADLWASLTAHLFDQLAAEFKAEEIDKYVRELASLKEQEAALESERDELGIRIDSLEKQVKICRQAREQTQIGLKATAKALAEAVFQEEEIARELGSISALGLTGAPVTVKNAKERREELQKLGAVAAGWKVKGWRKGVLVALLLAVPAAAWWGWLQVSRWAALGALLPAGVGWGWASGIVSAAIRAINRAVTKANEVEARVKELKPEEARLEQELKRFDEERLSLERKQADLARRRAEVEAWLESKKGTVSYKRFVLDRAASTDYRSKLGLINIIHRDLKDLSKKLKSREKPRVDRIILYIDDLDRCPPDRVVQVLQAVHLILSLELFVVVVAVDSRWLLQSLQAYYDRHFGKRRHRSDPQHYLEKIFQIPYAVAPMGKEGYGSLVRSLLGGSVVANEPERIGDPGRRVGEGVIGAPAPPRPAPARSRRPLASNLTPRNLEITRDEMENMQRLHDLLPSPRAVKRMVNLYRIVRARFDDDSIDYLLDGRYKLEQLFLAAVVGAPKEMSILLDRMFSGRIAGPSQLTELLEEHARRPGAWGALARAFALDPLTAEWDEIVEVARGSARFSFRTGRVLQPATASPKTPAPPPSGKSPPS